ncbi:MAG: S8 family serine peptidase [Thermoplasmatales archaeon]|nr:S8 family serine peptidase [Thermoplasmatales archaeon]
MIQSENKVNNLRTWKGLRLSVFVAIIIFTGFLAITTAHGDIVSQGKYTDISSQNILAPDEALGNGDTLKVLVGFRNTPGAKERGIIKAYNGNTRYEFKNVKAFAIDISAKNLEELARHPEVSYIEEDAPRYALGLADSELEPLLDNGLYGLITTRSIEAHEEVTGTGVNIGIADTGLDYTHPDIAPRYKGGIDTVDDDDDPFWDDDTGETHGTHVAGTVLAALNDEGVRGVAYGADLYHARVLGPDGSGSISGIMAGVEHLVVENDCKIISLSLGGKSKSRTEKAFYQDLYDNHGALIIAAAGNDGRSKLIYPAEYPVVVSVGAVDSNNVIADFSNYGNGLDLVAPGVNVLSSVPIGTGSEAEVIVDGNSYPAFGMEFAGKTEGITWTVVNCGTGNELSDFPAGVSGNIALMERGVETFATKVDNAMARGAAAAIIYNNVNGDFIGTLVDDVNSTGVQWIPAVSVSDITGAALVGEAGKTGTVINMVSDWDHYSGTSMATPHVAGVAGLVWSANPGLNNVDVEYILKNTASDLGETGYDEIYGNGLVDALAAVNFESSSDLYISDVYVYKVTSKKAVITWETNKPSDSRIEYGTSSGSLSLEAGNSDMVTSHSITLAGLSSSTKYYFQVKSTDASHNTVIKDNNGDLYEFTTLGRRV